MLKHVSDITQSDIAALEAHVKLLSDALDDERQDNQDLSEENVILKAQVHPSEHQSISLEAIEHFPSIVEGDLTFASVIAL